MLQRWIINTLALWLTAYVVNSFLIRGGIYFRGGNVFETALSALLAAAILGIVNALIRPVLLFLTIPINLLTLGLFTFVINGLMLLLVSGVVSGFHVSGLWAAIVGAFILSLISSALSSAFKK